MTNVQVSVFKNIFLSFGVCLTCKFPCNFFNSVLYVYLSFYAFCVQLLLFTHVCRVLFKKLSCPILFMVVSHFVTVNHENHIFMLTTTTFKYKLMKKLSV